MPKLRRATLFMISLLLLLGSTGPWPLKAASCPCNIWASTVAPTNASVNDPNAVELGVKFRSDTAGYITGIRFYKGANNGGTHTGTLWSGTGQQLATATFTGETASGWQQVNFASAVQVSANTTYVASYYAPVGNYAGDNGFFATTGVDNTPLHALKDGVDGPNGLYKYGASGFPNGSYQSSNYWVDVVFATSVVDTTPPTVISTSPASNATNVNAASGITATFSKSLDATTVTTSTVDLRDPANALVAATVSYDATNRIATMRPNAALAGNSTYTATIHGGTLDPRIKDTAGNALASNYTWKFTTAGPLPSQGPGGPILVINSASNPFSTYYTEILRNEGYTNFATADLANVTSTMLNSYDVVVLGELPLTAAQVTMLNSWVNNGGNLVAMKPDKQLAGLLGLTDANATLSNSYLKINTLAGPGQGLSDQTLQFHGSADKYALNGATMVAQLFSSASADAGNPAVTMRTVGSGHAAAFTYDLAKSVVQTRQGNSAWAGQNRDGGQVIRSDSLFYGPAPADPQPNWIDFNKVAIPQADEQQRLLGNLIQQLNLTRKPLPHFWYLPNNKKAAVVMTGDDHANGGTSGRFDQNIAASPSGCNVANWECVRSTSYIYASPKMTDAQAASYNNQGFEVALHVNTNCADWTPSTLQNFFSQQLNIFGSTYPSIPAPATNRTHCVAWSDWATQPKVENANGVRLDTTYYYYPGNWIANHPGYMTGSGFPMRFADTDGSLIDTYQAATQLTDESNQPYPYTADTLLDNATGSLGYYGVITANMHTDNAVSAGSDAIVASAKSRGIPVVSAKQMLQWLDGRNSSTFTNMAWNGSVLTFGVTVGNGAQSLLHGMLPTRGANGQVLASLTQSGAAVSYTTEVIKGTEYAIFPANTASYAATYAADTSAPTVNTVSPASQATNVPRDAQVKASMNKVMSANSISTSSFELRDASNTLVPAAVSYNANTKQAVLTPNAPLAANANYTATLRGGTVDPRVKDLAGNALAANYSWTFTTGSNSASISLWPASAVPGTPSANDPSAIEVGTKFTSDVSGYIKGIRFYKGATNTGTHIGNFWTSTGQNLATATFAGETANGWQQVNFATPVAVTAGTTYVASYFTTAGMYSSDSQYFSYTASDNYPLHGLQDGANGGNGVYVYGANSAFPNASYQGTNYWVDVVFSQTP